MPYRKYVISGLLAGVLIMLAIGVGAYSLLQPDTDTGYATRNPQTDAYGAVQVAHWHLGVFDGYVAVYEGPLGSDERVLRVEEVPVGDLAPECGRRLEQAMDFAAQTPEAQDRLRQELEFTTEAALHAALENLDELKD